MAKQKYPKIAELSLSCSVVLFFWQNPDPVRQCLFNQQGNVGKLATTINVFSRWYFPVSQKNQEIGLCKLAFSSLEK